MAKAIGTAEQVPTFSRDVRARRAAVGFSAARARVRRAALEVKAAAWDEERVGWDEEDEAAAERSMQAAKGLLALVERVTRTNSTNAPGIPSDHVAALVQDQEEGEPSPEDRKLIRRFPVFW